MLLRRRALVVMPPQEFVQQTGNIGNHQLQSNHQSFALCTAQNHTMNPVWAPSMQFCSPEAPLHPPLSEPPPRRTLARVPAKWLPRCDLSCCCARRPIALTDARLLLMQMARANVSTRTVSWLLERAGLCNRSSMVCGDPPAICCPCSCRSVASRPPWCAQHAPAWWCALQPPRH